MTRWLPNRVALPVTATISTAWRSICACPDRGLGQVRGAALQLAAGGVGYYPRSNFVHVDIGPVRRW